MSKKFINILLLQIIFLLMSVIAFSIISYVWDGSIIPFIIMMSILAPQAILMIVFIVKLSILKKSVNNWILIFIFALEVICIILMGLESFSNLFPIIGYSILYMLITVSWIMLTYENGTWGKKYKKIEETE